MEMLDAEDKNHRNFIEEFYKKTRSTAKIAALAPPGMVAYKKSDETPPALDLSSESVHQAPPPTKRIRRGSSDTAPTNTDNNTTSTNNTSSSSVSLCNLVSPCSHEAKEVKTWSIEDVCKFVSSVELCQPFVEVIFLCYKNQIYIDVLRLLER